MAEYIEWRRQHKSDLASAVWQPFQVNGCMGPTFVKMIFSESSYSLMWFYNDGLFECKAQADDILGQTKTMNPHLEAPLRRILHHIESVISAQVVEGVTFNVTQSNDNLDIDFTSNLASVRFVWTFSARRLPCASTSEMMVIPLLTTVSELHRQKTELEKLLARKDTEIADYTSQGALLSKRRLLTPAFDATAFRHQMATSQGFDAAVAAGGRDAFSSDDVRRLYGELTLKRRWLCREPESSADNEEEVTENNTSVVTGVSWGDERLPPSLVAGSVTPGVSPSKSPRENLEETAELTRRRELEEKLAKEEVKRIKKSKKKRLF
ncbi:PREDICTED: non-homologous end-joining factor 1-like [Priapulus caudatus]|uniref:Non-homologous end-joining factor 1 n=1 Tax=Priapulus caudatus TaxID=37621 RepID=A0ABM1DQI9_PRICU|nr:PREDICTED: non-homologous end-joining factor 1-like [Priapulus caudatus]